MPRYANLNGDSGVDSYHLGSDSITVTFRGGATYIYSYASTGQDDVEEMKSLALVGHGLNAYINRFVRKRYERRLA